MVIDHHESARTRAVAEIGFNAEIPTNGNKGMEDVVVAEFPWHKACEEDDACEHGVSQGILAMPRADQDPEPADGQEEKKRRSRERDDAPEQAEEQPLPRLT